jgi:hypothetical protein
VSLKDVKIPCQDGLRVIPLRFYVEVMKEHEAKFFEGNASSVEVNLPNFGSQITRCSLADVKVWEWPLRGSFRVPVKTENLCVIFVL